MKKILKVLLISGLTLVLFTGLFSNGLNLNSIGSKASAMGTAFVGLADDFSAVFFNPAGLTQMEQATLTCFVTSIIPMGTYRFELLGTTLADTKTASAVYPSGAVAYFKPISEKMVLGIAGYVPSGIGTKWPGEDLTLLSGGTKYIWDSFIAMITVSPVIAYKINDKFSVGASLNLNYAMLKMENPAGDGENVPYFQYKEKISGIAFGATLGIMVKPYDFLSIGAAFKTPISATIKGDADAPGLTQLGLSGSSNAERSATWPMWFGIGVAIKPNDRLTITADFQYNNWKKLSDIPVTYDDAGWKAAGMEQASTFELRWEDTTDIRFGIEYKVSDFLALRGGFYTDRAPSPEETLNIMLPSIDYKCVTFGLGYKKGKMSVDIAFEYVTGKDREVDPMNYLVGAGMPGTHGMKIVVPNITFTYKF